MGPPGKEGAQGAQGENYNSTSKLKINSNNSIN